MTMPATPTTVSGNAGTATKLATARSIALTGDATGSASFDGSANASIATTLASVATAGTTGETAAKTLAFGGTFVAPQITIDAKGRTTTVTGRTMTMPAAPTSVSGNAGTATKLATARAISLTGDATGTANFDGSAAASIATTLATVATAGTTGETAAKTLAFGGTFTVPQLTINAKGLTTAVNGRVMTMPAAPTSVSGNAGTATKLATARTLALAGGVTGSATFDGTANATITSLNRGGMIGQNTATDVATNCWFKLASTSVNGTNYDKNIVLLLTKPYSAKTSWGILYCGIRTDGTNGYFGSGTCVWLVQNGITVGNFVLAYQPSVKPFTAEIWVKCPSSYENYDYTVLEEGTRDARGRTDWTLSNGFSTGLTAITSGYTQIVSSNGSLGNPLGGNAATATKLATARSIALTGDATGTANFDGSANASIATTLATVATAGTTGETANKTLGYGGTFIVPQTTINAKGLTTAVTGRTMTMPAEPNGIQERVYITQQTYRYKWMGVTTTGSYVPLFPTDKTSTAVVGTWTTSTTFITPTMPIQYYDSTTTASGYGYVNLRAAALTNALYNLNVESLTSGISVYLIGKMYLNAGRELFVLNSSPYYTQTLPNSNDGYVYWNIGCATSTTQVQLNAVQPLYHYNNGIRAYVPGQYFDAASSRAGEVVCYVSPTGSDTNANNTGLSESAPMKTLGEAIRRFSHARAIYVNMLAGTHSDFGSIPTYLPLTRLWITGSVAGKANVILDGGDILLAGPSQVNISSLTIKPSTSVYDMFLIYDASVSISDVVFDSTNSANNTGANALHINKSRAYIGQCTFSNANRGVLANYSDISVKDTTINSTCKIGLHAYDASCIRRNNVTNNATTPTTANTGSSIF
jgi:sulfur transfer protein SufE